MAILIVTLAGLFYGMVSTGWSLMTLFLCIGLWMLHNTWSFKCSKETPCSKYCYTYSVSYCVYWKKWCPVRYIWKWISCFIDWLYCVKQYIDQCFEQDCATSCEKECSRVKTCALKNQVFSCTDDNCDTQSQVSCMINNASTSFCCDDCAKRALSYGSSCSKKCNL